MRVYELFEEAQAQDPDAAYQRLKAKRDYILDLKATYRRLKAKQKQLADDLQSLSLPHGDDENYDRKADYWLKMRKVMGDRYIALNHEVELLRAKLIAVQHAGKPEELLVYFNSQKTGYKKEYIHEIGRMIDAADANLPHPASEVITGFVGHGYSRNPTSGAIGRWTSKKLDDAYSPNPSPQGLEVRRQLDTAFAPIRAALKNHFGETVTIHRAQQPLTGSEPPRYVLSWTSRLNFAKALMDDGYELLTKTLPIDDIVWITDRANQAEFIMRHTPESSQ